MANQILIDTRSLMDGKLYNFNGTLGIEEISPLLGSTDLITPLTYTITVIKNKDELFVNGSTECRVEDICYRCLNPVQTDAKGIIEATYIYGNINDTSAIDKELESLENVIYYVGSEIDVFDRVVEAVIISLPERFLCSEDCRGICQYCGADLNKDPDHVCEHEDYTDENMSLLEQLKRQLESEE
ncbi:MAG TPA: DUF177 domain-containing protein [Thermotogota bacterium]|nr:DUF177 domain-containing protein [Thermotogota bacterium]HPJ88078.1 DUF177 domain-containing protein [Thermotogota bacterium]HPR96062.1 DUF177 domain-containing protein [Thermotogota bacterium]